MEQPGLGHMLCCCSEVQPLFAGSLSICFDFAAATEKSGEMVLCHLLEEDTSPLELWKPSVNHSVPAQRCSSVVSKEMVQKYSFFYS